MSSLPDLLYADQFSVDYYENDIALITIGDTDQFLLLPEGFRASRTSGFDQNPS